MSMDDKNLLRAVERMETHIQGIRVDVADMKKKQDDLVAWKNQVQGGKKVALWVLGGLGSAVALIVTFAKDFWHS